MKKIKLIIYFLIFVCFQACVGVTPSSLDTSPTNINSNVLTEVPSTQVTLPTFSTPEQSLFNKKCLYIDQEKLLEEVSNSKIIFENREVSNGRYLSGVILLNLATLEKNIIDNFSEHFLDIRESPDKTQIAYHLVKDRIFPDKLIIADADFQPIKIIDWKNEWNSIIGWSDENHIIITKNEDEISYSKLSNLIILDINTLSEKEIIPEFPNLYDFHPLPSWNGYVPIIYNSDFTKAIYMKWTDETKSTYGYAFWDVTNNKELAFQKIVYTPIPQWSPDESYFVTSGLINISPKDLFAVYENGQTKRLTNFDNYFQNAEVYNFSWSPNGDYLAILLIEESDNKKANLVLLNISTGVLTDYCTSVTIYGDTYTNTFVPLWSPDSNQLIIQDWYEIDHRKILMIDILNNSATILAEDVEPRAWLK
jgi:hypothetical protein